MRDVAVFAFQVLLGLVFWFGLFWLLGTGAVLTVIGTFVNALVISAIVFVFVFALSGGR